MKAIVEDLIRDAARKRQPPKKIPGVTATTTLPTETKPATTTKKPTTTTATTTLPTTTGPIPGGWNYVITHRAIVETGGVREIILCIEVTDQPPASQPKTLQGVDVYSAVSEGWSATEYRSVRKYSVGPTGRLTSALPFTVKPAFRLSPSWFFRLRVGFRFTGGRNTGALAGEYLATGRGTCTASL